MYILNYIEPLITVLVVVLTALNWLIKQRISLIEQRVTRLEDFEKTSQEAFKLLREIKGKIDMLLKNYP
ncbi:hypothetical protein [Campylobacter hyointestinalis]|uniref:hypothetical protein n=1 Tax=Campylobacter hyointestinalis TaxID=198 RepID=UPI000DCE858E|nr:hypothetical protein [Campylobacter hyointestinalis]RAZ57425.1 hypothetical protein CHL10074_00270 [Campylobacter hyointestinalis subsp. lawsonii]RAZ64980.1 hypothetical protein CHL9767_01935 [Campylobacter hyointestinalis subsp. lawsonii]